MVCLAFQYVFVHELIASQRNVHEELALQLKAILRPTQADFLVTGKFMKYSWFFFEILIKSMAQHLLVTGRIKVRKMRNLNVTIVINSFLWCGMQGLYLVFLFIYSIK